MATSPSHTQHQRRQPECECRSAAHRPCHRNPHNHPASRRRAESSDQPGPAAARTRAECHCLPTQTRYRHQGMPHNTRCEGGGGGGGRCSPRLAGSQATDTQASTRPPRPTVAARLPVAPGAILAVMGTCRDTRNNSVPCHRGRGGACCSLATKPAPLEKSCGFLSTWYSVHVT